MENKNEFPIRITIGNGEDAYEEVYNAISKYFYEEDGCMYATNYYVTLELVHDNLISWITACLEYDNDLCDFVWNTDWWEGENIIVIHGIAAVSSLRFHGLYKNEDINK